MGEGLWFDRCFGSGYRTDQGLVAVLNGYPAQPGHSIVLNEDKMRTLPSLPSVLSKNGWKTAFYYGGDPTFANLGVYLANQGFDRVTTEKDFLPEEKRQKWGADDHSVLQRAAKDLLQMEQPFFASVMTLSLHPPYDVPFESNWGGSDSEPQQFKHSAAFADQAIGEFFKTVEKMPFFDRTLFVLVADHGSSWPEKARMDTPRSRHIPLVFWGKPLKKELRGHHINDFSNHHDLAASLLPQIGLKDEAANFTYSRNLFLEKTDPSAAVAHGFGYFSNEDGLGWVSGSGEAFMNFETGRWQYFSGKPDPETEENAKAWLQCFFNDFVGRGRGK